MAAPLWRGEAPGRLDVLGGVADYSGSLVLQMPIRSTTRVAITPLQTAEVRLVSAQEGTLTLPLSWLQETSRLGGGALRERLDQKHVPHWARYSLGCFLLFVQAMDWWPSHGLQFHIESAVPTSMGVSSSAALEVATLRALEVASDRNFQGTALARLAQRAENEIVGAPCGLMDQLASAHGVQNALLPILCRPDVLSAPVPLPEVVMVAGWPSGVKHAVSDSPYATARAASFMAKKVLETVFSRKLSHLTELTPSQVRSVSEEALPSAISGADFLQKHGGVDDPLSHIHPERRYPVRAGALFPTEENFRCELAALLLDCKSQEEGALRSVGELMYQSHAAYSSIGLGCPETDEMVEAVRAQGATNGFYGARVSGGGSGGTVVVLLERTSLPVLEEMATQITGEPLIV